jgi:hypothetical protein
VADESAEPAGHRVELSPLGQGVPTIQQREDILPGEPGFLQGLSRRRVQVGQAQVLDQLVEAPEGFWPDVRGLESAAQFDRFEVGGCEQTPGKRSDRLKSEAAVRGVLLTWTAALAGADPKLEVLPLDRCRAFEGGVQRALQVMTDATDRTCLPVLDALRRGPHQGAELLPSQAIGSAQGPDPRRRPLHCVPSPSPGGVPVLGDYLPIAASWPGCGQLGRTRLLNHDVPRPHPDRTPYRWLRTDRAWRECGTWSGSGDVERDRQGRRAELRIRASPAFPPDTDPGLAAILIT